MPIDYHKHKQAGLCVRCGEKALPGLTKCRVHLWKDKQKKAKYRKNNREKLRLKRKEEYQKRILKNRCTACGQKLPNGYVFGLKCAECSEHKER